MDLSARLNGIFATVFPELTPEEIPQASSTSLDSWDSLAAATLVALVEEEFDLQILPEELDLFSSYRSIMNYLREKLCAPA